MTVVLPTGAASHLRVAWHQINWERAYRNVRRLQARIVKATQEGRWGKVKALQHLLTHSFSAKALAVRRVTENPGKHTPGVDHQTWETPEKKATALYTLRQRGYHALPLRRVYIPKRSGKMRPLGIPTLFDRAMQALNLLALEPVSETTADPNSYGFRPQRSTADAIDQCFNALSRAGSAQWVLEGDIKSCYDQISHEWLLTHIPLNKHILASWLKAGYIEHHVCYPTEAGVPQGGIISPTLANMTLDGLERHIAAAFPTRATYQRAKVHLIRYADDFVATGASREILETVVKPAIMQFLHERGLALSTEKTSISHIAEGFDFLGHHLRKYNTKLLIKPAKANLQAFLTRLRAVIKANQTQSAGQLVRLLNPLIRGWAYYHRHCASKTTFSSVDHAIFEKLWRWARRRHPSKSARWIRKKYFHTIGGRHWVFHGEVNGITYNLFSASRVSIRRHIKVKAAANPYDPDWEIYFERRLAVKIEETLKGRRQLLRLWKEQDGRCPVCDQPITEITRWHNHHIVWRVMGGVDRDENRVLLHPNCHQQVHVQKLFVAKPRPKTGV